MTICAVGYSATFQSAHKPTAGNLKKNRISSRKQKGKENPLALKSGPHIELIHEKRPKNLALLSLEAIFSKKGQENITADKANNVGKKM
jgi:hypothetical protein